MRFIALRKGSLFFASILKSQLEDLHYESLAQLEDKQPKSSNLFKHTEAQDDFKELSLLNFAERDDKDVSMLDNDEESGF